MSRYNPSVIEPKWQKYWAENNSFAAPRLPAIRKRCISSTCFRIKCQWSSCRTSGRIHRDRYRLALQSHERKSVLHPMGWDAFGLPAEQHAKRRDSSSYYYRKEYRELQTPAPKCSVFRSIGIVNWQRPMPPISAGRRKFSRSLRYVVRSGIEKGRPISELPIPGDVTAPVGSGSGH